MTQGITSSSNLWIFSISLFLSIQWSSASAFEHERLSSKHACHIKNRENCFNYWRLKVDHTSKDDPPADPSFLSHGWRLAGPDGVSSLPV